MKNKEQWAYCWNCDQDNFGGLFDTKEEAIQAVRNEWEKERNYEDEKVYIGIAEFYEEHSNFGELLCEKMNDNAWDEYYDVANDYMKLSAKHQKIFNDRIKQCIRTFQEEFGYEPDFYCVKNVEIIYLENPNKYKYIISNFDKKSRY